MWEEILKALHCQKYHNIQWKTENVFFLALMVTMDPVGSVKFVEIMSRHHETYKKKALKLIKPIQYHFPVSLVQKIRGFGFRCLKHIWISMVIFYFQQMFFFKTILGVSHKVTCNLVHTMILADRWCTWCTATLLQHI